MEFDSPVKKKKRSVRSKVENKGEQRKCLIHVVSNADDATLSAFTEQSWKVGTLSTLSYALFLAVIARMRKAAFSGLFFSCQLLNPEIVYTIFYACYIDIFRLL